MLLLCNYYETAGLSFVQNLAHNFTTLFLGLHGK